MLIHYAYYQSPIGLLRLTFCDIALCKIDIVGQNEQWIRNHDPIPQNIMKVQKWLDSYFNGSPSDADGIHLKLDGTPFQKAVWKHLQKIPYGQYKTYGQIAIAMKSKLGVQRMSAQAIGQAVGKNPLLILVPCHRVLGSNMKLTGFSAGIEVKKLLLDHENIPYTEL